MKLAREIRKSYHDLLKTEEWREFSEEQFGKANYECWACEGADRYDLQVHHLVYRDVLPWEYRDEEVRVLCKDCHKAVHLVADLVWVECLRYQPHELEVILKRLKNPGRRTVDELDVSNGLNPARICLTNNPT